MTSTMPDLSQRYGILLEMSRRISRTFDLPEILHYLLDAVRQVVPYDAAGVFVLNRSLGLPGTAEDRVVAAMATVGFDPHPEREDPMLRSGKGIIGHVITTGLPVVAPDIRLDRHYVPGRCRTMSELAVPISSNGKVIGALNLESDGLAAYSDADVDELGYFAAVAAISDREGDAPPPARREAAPRAPPRARSRGADQPAPCRAARPSTATTSLA